jgi:3-oxoacyl-[acyl-carrier-protein] synthase II
MVIAVTGMGTISACGWGLPAFWQALAAGESRVGEPLEFDTAGHRTRLVAEAPPPPAELLAELERDPRWQRLSRAERFAVAACREAFRDAGLRPEDAAVAGLYFGGSTAAMAEGERFFRSLTGRRPGKRPRVAEVAAHPLDAPAGAAARFLGIRGPVDSCSSACASGALALAAALDALRAGRVELALAGGADSLCQLTYAGFNSLRAVDEGRCRPFRSGRAGLNLGEGAGILVLEPLERALARGRKPLVVLAGAGASCDAHHMTAPHPEGEGASRAIEAALADAGLPPSAIDFVNVHGTGTPLNDQAESRALHRVFGPRAAHLPLTSTKGVVGHLLGSSGAIEAVATVLSLQHGAVTPTPGEGEVDASLEIDLVVGAPRPLEARHALSTSLAFGGSNAALVFSRLAAGRSGDAA